MRVRHCVSKVANFFDAERYFARMAEQLGKEEDAAHARAHADKIRAALMPFYDPNKHTFGNGTHDSLALAFGVIQDPAKAVRSGPCRGGRLRTEPFGDRLGTLPGGAGQSPHAQRHQAAARPRDGIPRVKTHLYHEGLRRPTPPA
jgi:hypothetical protein